MTNTKEQEGMGGKLIAGALAAIVATAAAGGGDPRVEITVESVAPITKALPREQQMRVRISRAVCTVSAGDSVPVATDAAHGLKAGDKAAARVRFRYLGQGVVDCETREGLLVMEVSR